jgi:hypothetical protein
MLQDWFHRALGRICVRVRQDNGYATSMTTIQALAILNALGKMRFRDEATIIYLIQSVVDSKRLV